MAAYKAGEPENLITLLQAELECELTLLGATAIEDKLQEGVPISYENRLCTLGLRDGLV